MVTFICISLIAWGIIDKYQESKFYEEDDV